MGFIKGLIDDRDKSVNPAIVLTGLLTFSSICWVTYLVVKNHAMPELTGVAALLGGTSFVNLVQKSEDIVAKFRKHDGPEGTPKSV